MVLAIPPEQTFPQHNSIVGSLDLRIQVPGGVEPLKDRPALARWYETVRQRPGFDAADVWERMKPGKMLAMIATKLWPQLTAILLTVAALCARLWWLLA